MDYILSLYSNKIYKEIKITEDISNISIGTFKDCQIRIKKARYYADFRVNIIRQGDVLVASCSEDTYFDTEDNRSIREVVTQLIPGKNIKVCFAELEIPFLTLGFSFDFGNIQDNYSLCIDTPIGRNYVIGGIPSADIHIEDSIMGMDSIVYSHQEAGFYEVDFSNSRYGININGFFCNAGKKRLYNRQFFSFCGHIFFIDGEKLYTSSNISIRTNLNTTIIKESNNQYKYPKFIRSVRQEYVVPDDTIKVLPPQNKPKESSRAYLLNMLPMLVSMIAMIGLRFAMGSNPFYIIYFALFMGTSVIVSIVRCFKTKKEYKEAVVKRERVYREYIDKKVEQIENARAEEKLILNRMEIPADKALEEIEDFDFHLFQKEKKHEDYLMVNVGQGSTLSMNQIKFNEREVLEIEDEFMNYPEQIHESYKYISETPVMLDLKNENAVGVVGQRDKLFRFAQNLIVSIAGQHFYSDLKMMLIIDENDIDDFAWCRWIKHFVDEKNGRRFILSDNESVKSGQEYIYNVLSQREQSKEKDFQDYVVFVYRSEQISGHPINNFIERARELGFTFVFFEEYEELLHHDCDSRVFLDADNNCGYMQKVSDGTNMQSFTYPVLSRKRVEKAALKMAGIYVDETSLENTLTKSITLYEILGIMNAYDLDIRSRWENSKVYESMAAPLGVRGDASTVYLDIHEKAHGPHGLVAGTTGSGKSEIMQSYIVSLASLFHPYEVGFILIDFKGGGMANQFKNLPHLNGAITNIDGKQIDRSLSSIKAELMKRQTLFAEYEVNHIDDYIKLFKDGTAKIPLPHLILIVDEFAELKSEQPEFMKELISTARIGRSLGVHLILATQKPAGVVNDQIWSNSRFKLCLKVQDKHDSNEVIKSPLAAEIKEPGRAYLQVGNNEIFELFQSGYSGAPAQVEGVDEKNSYEICSVALDGKKTIIYKQGKGDRVGTDSQLDALVKRINDFCIEEGIKKLPDICLPPLAEIIHIPAYRKPEDTKDIIIPIGIYDDPKRQKQDICAINLTQENVAIVGTTQSGKTNLLQTVVRTLAENYTPSEVVMYVMDFASMAMRAFDKLAHVGGVATMDEPEKVRNLLRLLRQEITKRKQAFSNLGISSFSEYLDAGLKEFPQIVFLLDNMVVFKETFSEYSEALADVIREGNSMGICTIMTSPQGTGYGIKILANCSRRIVINSNDDMDYTLMLNKCKLRPDENPGRCVLVNERENYEAQIFLAFDAEKEIERKAQIDSFIKNIDARYADKSVTAIPEVPQIYDDKYISDTYNVSEVAPYQLLIGLNYADTQPIYLDLLHKNLLVLAGQQRHRGKRSYINYIVRSLSSANAVAPVEFHILDSYERLLDESKDLETVKTYTLQVPEIDAAVENIVKRLEERRRAITEGTLSSLEKEPLIVIMLNSSEYYNMVSASPQGLMKYKEILQKYISFRVAIILTDVPNASVVYGAPEITRSVAGQKHILMYENVGNIKVMEIPVAFQRTNKRPIKAGEVFMLNEGELLRIKTPVWKQM